MSMKNPSEAITIKKAAELGGVGIETVRFYERERLIPAPPRTASGYRQYPLDTAARIRFIKRAQALGFSLPEIKDLLTLKLGKRTKREDIRKRARKKIENIDLKIRTLQQIKRTLEDITAACHDDGPLSECPILKAFEENGRRAEKRGGQS